MVLLCGLESGSCSLLGEGRNKQVPCSVLAPVVTRELDGVCAAPLLE